MGAVEPNKGQALPPILQLGARAVFNIDVGGVRMAVEPVMEQLEETIQSAFKTQFREAMESLHGVFKQDSDEQQLKGQITV